MNAPYVLLSGSLVAATLAFTASANAQEGAADPSDDGISIRSEKNQAEPLEAPQPTQPTQPAEAPPEAQPDSDSEWAERDRKLNEGSTLTGGVGLVHTQHATGGAAGQFRVEFLTEWFSAGFLCTPDFPCPNPSNAGSPIVGDTNDHVGGRLRLTAQLLPWLETYLATSALANSNEANRPALLQVLGDSTLGGKAFRKLSNVASIGGGLDLGLVNGTGAVGLDGGGTSIKFRGLATADLREAEKKKPMRASVNLTYALDNSGAVIADTEAARGKPITRIERYGLNINRVDHFDIHIGTEYFVADERVRPFLEYQVLIPINRQGYACRLGNPSKDRCLALDPFASSTLTIGSRFFPWKRGLNILAALDVGVSGVGTFLEEVRPTPPWMLYLGAGWAYDTADRPPVIKEKVVTVAPPPEAPTRKIRGLVHEEGKAEGIPNAIVAWENHPEWTALATGADGRFTTQGLAPGAYVFSIRAEGYKPGQCQTTLAAEPPAPAPEPAPAAAPEPTPAPAPAPIPTPGGDVLIDCTLQSLPRVATIVGKLRDAESGAPVAGATVSVVDSARKELSATADAQGAFRMDNVSPGEATLSVTAEGYYSAVEKLDAKPRQESTFDFALRKQPRNSLVSVGAREIVIKQQVQFAVTSATILSVSTPLLMEIADVLMKNPRIRRVEVQGHTDNSGSPQTNQKLSADRANAVVAWLTSHGVAPERLVAKGYGDANPLVPNVTELNKQRNRRVQFIIVEQDSAPNLGGAGGARK